MDRLADGKTIPKLCFASLVQQKQCPDHSILMHKIAWQISSKRNDQHCFDVSFLYLKEIYIPFSFEITAKF